MSARRIGLNLLWMVPGVVGGSEEYTTRLLHAVAEHEPDDVELVLFVNRLVPEAHPKLVASFETVVAPLTGRHKPVRVLGENSWLAAEARRHRIELVHHLGGIMPFVRGLPSMVTIHDLQPLAMPAHFSPVKRAFHRMVMPPSARKALRVVTLTEYTRRDLIARLDVQPERVVLVPSGITMPLDDDAGVDIDLVRRRYGLGQRQLFVYPAITYPHKNHLMLLDAFATVARDHPDAALVLTGGSAQMESEVRRAATAPELVGRVFRLGRIPSDDLDALYRTALALTFPSRFEGFGIPVLEAMSRGLPVVAADATALPEVVGDAGLLVDPRDVQGWALAMNRLLDDDDLRRQMAERGLDRARQFDWPSAAEELEQVYRSVLDEVRRR